ncbi:MAG TPA: DUF2809 domain-containing protein [Pyrinomonadaceae bacterium]|jgi:hypothetical protein
MQLTFNGKYLLLAAILFAVEVCIALFVKDTIVRPFVGDALVVILIYCFLKIFLNVTDWKLALGVLLFACLIEILQSFDYVARLGLENNRVLSVMMGRTFEWMDFVAYFAGFLFIILIDFFSSRTIKTDL